MNKLRRLRSLVSQCVMAVLLILSGMSLPLVSIITTESDILAIAIESYGHCNDDTAQAENLPNDSEAEEHQEELAIPTDLNIQSPEHYCRYFFKCPDKILIGTRLDLTIPPS